MQKKLKNLWSDSFWRNNAVFFAASLLISLINYIYYPVLGRIMDISHFGEVQTLLSIINIAGMLLAALQIVIINISANQQKQSQKNTEIINQFEHATLLFMLVVAIIISAASPILKNFFSFSSFVPFIILAITLLIGVSFGFRKAYLQGKRKFTAASLGGIIAAVGKLIFSVLFIVAGFKTIGAITGALIAQLIAFAYCAKVAKKTGQVGIGKNTFGFKKLLILRPQLEYLTIVIVVSLVATLLFTGDVLVAKRYFSPEVAGQYAGVSTIAKTIFFVTASFSGVLLASVGQTFSAKHNFITVRKSLILLLTIGGAILIAFCLLSNQVIQILLGHRYTDYAYLLPRLSLLMYLVSIANLCFYYLLALRNKIVLPLALIGGLVTFLLTMLWHGSLEVMVRNFLAGAVTLVALIAGLSIYYYLKSVKKLAA